MDQHFFRLKKDYVVKSEGSFTLVSSGTGCLIMIPMLPMIDLSFRRKLEDGEESRGTVVSIPHSNGTELMICGVDAKTLPRLSGSFHLLT